MECLIRPREALLKSWLDRKVARVPSITMERRGWISNYLNGPSLSASIIFVYFGLELQDVLLDAAAVRLIQDKNKQKLTCAQTTIRNQCSFFFSGGTSFLWLWFPFYETIVAKLFIFFLLSQETSSLLILIIKPSGWNSSGLRWHQKEITKSTSFTLFGRDFNWY